MDAPQPLDYAPATPRRWRWSLGEVLWLALTLSILPLITAAFIIGLWLRR